jgi:hypothetical protein
MQVQPSAKRDEEVDGVSSKKSTLSANSDTETNRNRDLKLDAKVGQVQARDEDYNATQSIFHYRNMGYRSDQLHLCGETPNPRDGRQPFVGDQSPGLKNRQANGNDSRYTCSETAA